MKDSFNEFDPEDTMEDDFPSQDNYDYDDVSDFDNLDNYDDIDYDYFNDYHNYDVDDNIYRDETNNSYDETEDEEEDFEKKDLRGKLIKIIFIIILVSVVLGIIIGGSNNLNKKPTKKSSDVKVVKKENTTDFTKMFIKVKEASLKYFDEQRLKSATVVDLKTLYTVKLLDDISGYNSEESTIKLIKQDNYYELNIVLVKDKIKKTQSYNVYNYNYCEDTYLCEIKEFKEKEQVQETRNYLYEYVKETSKLSSWSSWSSEVETSCNTQSITCNDNNCLKEINVISNNINTGSSNKIYRTSRLAFKTNGKEIKAVCRDYDYIKINGIYYRTDNNSNFKDVGLIKKTTQNNYNNWIYKGRSSYKNPPNDTITDRYVFVEADYSNCGSTCNDGPNYYYDKYSFNRNLNYTVNPESDCSNLIQKGIPDYSIKEQQIGVSRLENNYRKVCYKKERTRQVIKNAKESKWSEYNDQELLNNGYVYSGEKKKNRSDINE